MNTEEIEKIKNETALEWIKKSEEFESKIARAYPARFLFDISLQISEQCSEELKEFGVPNELINLIDSNWVLLSAATSKSCGVLSDFDALWLSQELPGMIKAIKEYEPFEKEFDIQDKSDEGKKIDNVEVSKT